MATLDLETPERCLWWIFPCDIPRDPLGSCRAAATGAKHSQGGSSLAGKVKFVLQLRRRIQPSCPSGSWNSSSRSTHRSHGQSTLQAQRRHLAASCSCSSQAPGFIYGSPARGTLYNQSTVAANLHICFIASCSLSRPGGCFSFSLVLSRLGNKAKPKCQIQETKEDNFWETSAIYFDKTNIKMSSQMVQKYSFMILFYCD